MGDLEGAHVALRLRRSPEVLLAEWRGQGGSRDARGRRPRPRPELVGQGDHRGPATDHRALSGQMRVLVVSLTALGLLAGCASSSSDWAKAGASDQELGRDTADCLAG